MRDPITLFWILLGTTLSSYGVYVLLTDDKNAAKFYVYGKSLDLKNKKGWFWQLYLLPKRYFIHFYILATLMFLTSIATVFIYYVPSNFNKHLNNPLKKITNLASHYNVHYETVDSLASVTSLLFTLILMLIQSSRRLYETLFISVFSSKSKINILHYVFGHMFYVAVSLSTIIPILLSNTSEKYSFTSLLDNLVTTQRAVAFVLFIYASHCQQKCNIILANLRKDKTGRAITEQHYAPSGGLFEYVSCPHFLTEVIIYFTILIAQEFKNPYWNLIFLLVLSTQVINAMMEHKWYKKKHSDYPKERKAIVPGLL